MSSLSLLAKFDDTLRCTNVLINSNCDKEFLQFVLNQIECFKKWAATEQECRRLQMNLEKAAEESRGLENKLSHARRMLEQEKKRRLTVEAELDKAEERLEQVREAVFHNRTNINDETKEKLAFLNSAIRTPSYGLRDTFVHPDPPDKLETISEAMDSTGSVLSDLSFSRSEDDLDASTCRRAGRAWKRHQPSTGMEIEQSSKRNRRSKEFIKMTSPHGLITTTTVTVTPNGPVTASASIEPSYQVSPLRMMPPLSTNATPATPYQRSPSVASFGFGAPKTPGRGHVFVSKTVVRPEKCQPCGKRIKFAKVAARCRECGALVHVECKDQVPLPCVPPGCTPTRRGGGTISDYTPMSSPMVPALIVHCINEVEARGMKEIGLYRIPGSEKEVRGLKEKFLSGKGCPNLSGLDIHVICGTIKDFLRGLQEPLVSYSLWNDFVQAAEAPDQEDGRALLYQAVSELPQPNRDTLAFLVVHLQRVAESAECKMPAQNLARVFGPTIVGYSSSEPEPASMLSETPQQAAVVEKLMAIPAEYWNKFANVEAAQVEPLILPRQPSSHSIYNTPPFISRTFRRKGERFFATPPVQS